MPSVLGFKDGDLGRYAEQRSEETDATLQRRERLDGRDLPSCAMMSCAASVEDPQHAHTAR